MLSSIIKNNPANIIFKIYEQLDKRMNKRAIKFNITI